MSKAERSSGLMEDVGWGDLSARSSRSGLRRTSSRSGLCRV